MIDRDNKIAEIPTTYSAKLHITRNFVMGLGLLALTLFFWISDFSIWPIFLLMVFVFHTFEYMIHRFIFHGTNPRLAKVRAMHAIHHVVFYDDNYEIKSDKELIYVLWSATTFLSILGVFCLPMSLLIGYYKTSYGVISFSAFLTYFLLYEITHLAAHLPSEHKLLSIKTLRRIKNYHRQHHLPNGEHSHYGVVTPLYDKLLG